MRLVAFLVLCSSLCVAACSSDSEEGGGSTSGTGGTGGTSGTGGGDAGDGCGNFCTATECCECSASQCTTPYDACRCEPDCLAIIECIRDCPQGDTACQDGCFSSNPIGSQIYVALESCAQKFCKMCFSAPGDAGAD